MIDRPQNWLVPFVLLLALVGLQPDARSAISPSRSVAPLTAQVFVDAVQPGAPVSADLWGTNLTQQADAARTVESTTFVSLTRQIGVTLVRWPGGNNADAYDWKRNVDIRPGRRKKRPNGVALARILRFARDTGTDLSITINFGTMSAQDAADLVEFLNGPADSTWGAQRAALGFPEPLGVRYFEVGNEIGQPHMWYYAWTAEDPMKYFFGGSEERRGFYNNVGSKEYDPLGAKGDFFKTSGGPNQVYTLRFPPVRNVTVYGFVDQDAAQSCLQTYRQTGIMPTVSGQCEPWTQVNDLSGQPANARAFLLDAEKGEIHFGDGVHGLAPPAGGYFLVEYTTYGHDGFLDIARAMRAARSSVPIHIGAAILPFVDGQPITDTAGMQAIFEQMDFYVRHQYGSQAVEPSSGQAVGASTYSTVGWLRQIPLERVEHLAAVYERVRQYAQATAMPQVPNIAVTEWNVFLDQQYWHINRTQMGAVIAAEWFARLLNARASLPVLYANQFALGGGNLALIRSQTDASLAPMAYVFQGFRDWPGSRLLPISVESPGAVAHDREVPYVSAAAALAPDGQTLRLVLVNNAITDTITTTLHITGFVPARVHVWQLGADSPLADNDHGAPRVVPQESTEPIPPATWPLPPHSVTFLEMKAVVQQDYLPFLERNRASIPSKWER